MRVPICLAKMSKTYIYHVNLRKNWQKPSTHKK